LTLTERLITIIIGSIFYRFVLVVVLYMGFNADDLKLVSAIILVLALMLPGVRAKLRLSSFLKGGELIMASKEKVRSDHDTVVVNQRQTNEKTILEDVSLTLHDGDFVTVLGFNGAGKSTLFNVIAGTLPLTSGHIFLGERDVTKL